MDALYGLLFLLSGLGVLLFGISGLGQGLEGITSNSLRRNINKMSKNRYLAFASGAGSTILVQSSSVSIVMYIGLINIGALTLMQALPMFLGANFGSSLVLLIFCFESFNLVEFFGLFALVGALIAMFAKKPAVIKLGKTITCFGLLFCGMKMMSIGMEAVTSVPSVASAIESMTNPFLLVLIGVVLGMCLHCLGTSALLVSLMASGDATMTLLSALYVMSGANIGTTFVSIIACLKSNITAKRATAFNVYVSVLTSIFMVIIFACTPYVEWVSTLIDNPSFLMIITLIVFNAFNVVLQLFLVTPASKVLYKILPDKQKDEKQKIFVLEPSLYDNLPIASHQILKGMQELAEEQTDILQKVEAYFNEPTKRKKANLIAKINIFMTNITQTKSNIFKITTNEESRYVARLQYYQNVLQESERIATSCLAIINKIEASLDLKSDEKLCTDEYFKLIKNISKAHQNIYNIKEKEILENVDIEIADDFVYDKELAELRVKTKKILYKNLEKTATNAEEKKEKLQKFDSVFTLVQTLENIANNINNQILKIY